MRDAAAKVMFVVTAGLLVGTLAVLFVTSQPSTGARVVVAEFEDAFPLIEGMNVRVGGATAGSVSRVEVNSRGLAEVTLALDDTIEKPRADATAAIRQQDTAGDSYVAFDPGRSSGPLEQVHGVATIRCRARGPEGPCARTLVAPRLDDLLSAFGPSERTGIQLMLSEAAAALDQRGAGLNRAALDLRPGLVAARRVLSQVGRQNAALRSVIANAAAVTGRAAARRSELGAAIDSTASLLSVTAARTRTLDAGLVRLPRTVRRARGTLAALTRAAVAARPLAEELRAGAPRLITAVDRAPAFLSDLSATAARVMPTLRRTRKLVRDGAPTIKAGPTRVVTGPFDLAPAISNLLRGVLGEDETIKAFFAKDFGLGAIGAEPGNQLGYPASHANRHFLRISAILNCEAFGVPVRPGCLVAALSQARQRQQLTDRSQPAGASDQRPTQPQAPVRPRPSSPEVRPTAPDVKAPIKAITDLLKQPAGPGAHPPASGEVPVRDLLDFLLGP